MSLPLQHLSFEVLIWILICVAVSIGVGVIIGRGLALRNMTAKLRGERQKMLIALQTLATSTEQLTTDVDNHNNELATVERNVADTAVTGDFEAVQDQLLQQISAVIKSNRRLEDDLVVTRYKLEEQAQELDSARVEARTDQLSGLHNRKAFDETLQFMLSKFKRADSTFAIVLADVDHFKRINDTHGHQAGDNVVALLGKTFSNLVRPCDHVARFGGDEFAILLTGLGEENAHRAAGRIRNSIERANFAVGTNGAHLAVTISMGMAFPHHSDTVDTLFDRADQALYRSKEAGRNQLQIEYGPDTTTEPDTAVAVEV